MSAFAAAQGNQIDVLPLLLEHTMHTTTQFLGLQSSGTTVEDQKDFRLAMEVGSNGIITRLILGTFYWLYNTRAFRSACTHVRGSVANSVQSALIRTAKEAEAATAIASNDMMDRESQDKEQANLLDDLALQTRDVARLTSLASDVLLAGRDTTAALLSGLVFYLARDSVAYAKLRQAVLGDFGTRAGDDYLSFEQLKQCQYLQFCMKETLRLSPSVAYGFMTALVDTTLPAGGGPRGDRPILVEKVCELFTYPRL